MALQNATARRGENPLKCSKVPRWAIQPPSLEFEMWRATC